MKTTKTLASSLLMAAAAILCGCTGDGVAAARHALAQYIASQQPRDAASVEEPAAPIVPAQEACSDEIAYGDLDWCWGGFDGSKALPADGCRIGSLNVGGIITYKWLDGGCETLGATSHTDADHTVACLFVLTPSGWKGGKFDWISTSRTSRDLANIRSGYHGWSYAAFSSASQYAFAIVSKDGRRRSNIILYKR